MTTGKADRVSRTNITNEMVLRFHDLWSSRSSECGIPRRDQFSIEDLRPWFGNIVIMDVVDFGADFKHRLIGTRIVETVGRDLTGKLVSQCDYAIGAGMMLVRYREVMNASEPMFHAGEVIWSMNRSWLRFEMVSAPLSADGTGVNKLITAMLFAKKI